MSDDSDIIQIEPSAAPSISHRRILWAMPIIIVIGSLASYIFISRQFGTGVILGGILSFINYYWMKVSLKRIFDDAVAQGEKPKFMAVRYFARYATLGAILTIVFLTETIPVLAVAAGLSSFALAIMLEGFISIFTTIFKSRKL